MTIAFILVGVLICVVAIAYVVLKDFVESQEDEYDSYL